MNETEDIAIEVQESDGTVIKLFKRTKDGNYVIIIDEPLEYISLKWRFIPDLYYEEDISTFR